MAVAEFTSRTNVRRIPLNIRYFLGCSRGPGEDSLRICGSWCARRDSLGLLILQDCGDHCGISSRVWQEISPFHGPFSRTMCGQRKELRSVSGTHAAWNLFTALQIEGLVRLVSWSVGTAHCRAWAIVRTGPVGINISPIYFTHVQF